LDDHKEDGLRLRLATALPLSVWQEHLMPLLSTLEAARLRVVCKAMKVLVNEWPMEPKHVTEKGFDALLTCFPATESLGVVIEEPLAGWWTC
jgi:hypothetical protein